METATATKTIWNVDPMHSEVQFKVRHLVISTVTGSFEEFTGSIESKDTDFDNALANFSAKTASINTGVSDRDNHLRSEDFFAAEQYPTLDFQGRFEKQSENQFKLVGDLSIRGITKKVSFDATLGGVVADGYGQTKAGFEINGSINRKEFGLSWSQVTEAGGVVVGDEVKLHFNVQFTKA